MKKRGLSFGLLLSLVVFGTTPVHAGGPYQEKGLTELGLSAGFGDNFHAQNNVREDIQFYFLTPYWGKVLGKPVRFGSLEFAAEGFLSYVRQDSEDRYAVGITPLIVFNFKNLGRTVPFLEVGAGVLYTDLDPGRLGSHFNFTPQAGIGIRFEIGQGRFIRISYRYHHISNAGIDDDNSSIDSNFFMMGISFLR